METRQVNPGFQRLVLVTYASQRFGRAGQPPTCPVRPELKKEAKQLDPTAPRADQDAPLSCILAARRAG